MVIKIVQQSRSVSKKDIKAWRDAWAIAENATNPSWWRLMDVFADVMIDSHLSGAIGQRKRRVIKSKIDLVDINTGEVNDEATKLIRKKWFRKFTLRIVFLNFNSFYWLIYYLS